MKTSMIFFSFIAVCLLSILSLYPVMAEVDADQKQPLQSNAVAKASPTQKPPANATPLPILFDDFKGKSFEGVYDKEVWEDNIDDEICKIEKTNEGLFFALKSTKSETECRLISKEKWYLKDFAHIESRMKLLKSRGENWGGVEVILLSDDSDWYMSCHLGKSEDDPPHLNCLTPLWDIPPNPGGVVGSFDRWRTFRMDIEPITMTFTFYLDNQYYTKYTPPDAHKLKNQQYRIMIGLNAEEDVMVEGIVNKINMTR